MTDIIWTPHAGGSWGLASNWGTNGLPTQFDKVSILVPGITVSVDAGVTANAYSLRTVGAKFAITGGLLDTIHLAVFNGGFSQSGGVFTVSGLGAQFFAPMSFTGGTINVLTGALQINDGGSLAGTLAGTGVLDITGYNGATVYVNAGFTCKLSSILLESTAKVSLTTNLLYGHNFTAVNAVVDLFGHTLTTFGPTVLSGVIGNGVIDIANTLTLGTGTFGTTLDNGLQVNVLNTAIQSNNLALGVSDSGAKLAVAKTGHYAINGNWNITDTSLVGSISNNGVFAKTGGGKVSQIDASVSSAGTLLAGIGELRLNGLVNAIGGTVSGAGTLGISGNQTTFAPKLALSVAALHQEGGVLVLNGPQAYAGEWGQSGGVLDLNTAKAVLTLSGRSNFDGGRITSYGGTLALSGQAEMNGVTIGGPTVINVTGTLDQTGNIVFGGSSNPVANIAAKASWLIEGDSSITGSFGLISNAGLLSDPNGSGIALVQTDIISTGTIVSNGTLTLAGSNILGGTLAGTGLLDIAGPTLQQATNLSAGLAIKVAALDISSTVVLGGALTDAGVVTQHGGVVDLAGFTFGLSGSASLDGGTLTDGGVLASAGQTTINSYIVTGGSELLISGQADQTGNLTLADGSGAGTLAIASGAAYTVLDDIANNVIVGPAGLVSVSGLLTENGTGTASIEGTVNLAASGTIAANNLGLSLLGGGALSGTLSGTGRIVLGTGTFALDSGLSLLSAGFTLNGNATVQLGANQAFAGDFTSSGATVALGADTFSLSGPAVLGRTSALTISGTGTLAAAGDTTLGAVNVITGANLVVSGVAQQTGYLQVGDPAGGPSTATFAIAKTGTDTLLANTAILGDGTLSVAGGLLSSGSGLTQIGTGIVDTGTIAANLGTLQILSTVTASSTGSFAIAKGATLDFFTNASVGPATGVNFTGAGILRIDDLKTFGATIENFTATNDTIQIAALNAASLTGSYGNSAHTLLIVSDGQSQIVLNFSTAQDLGAITLGAGVLGVATLTHH